MMRNDQIRSFLALTEIMSLPLQLSNIKDAANKNKQKLLKFDFKKAPLWTYLWKSPPLSLFSKKIPFWAYFIKQNSLFEADIKSI